SDHRLAGAQVRGEADAAVVDDRLLHRDLDALTPAGGVALVERGGNPERQMDAGPGVAGVRAGLDRRPALLAGDRERAAGRLGDHVEAEELAVRAVLGEPFDLGVDDARIERADFLVAEAEPLDGTGREVLDE